MCFRFPSILSCSLPRLEDIREETDGPSFLTLKFPFSLSSFSPSLLMPVLVLQDLHDRFSSAFRPWERSLQFWFRASHIYTSYKFCQLRSRFVKDREKEEILWERQHEFAAEKIYAMCSELGGFFLKVAQIVGKPDLAPAAWVKRLVTLYDKAPSTPFDVVQLVLEQELGSSLDKIFERFDKDPIGSASIAQVHKARIRGAKDDVAVKVQHPGVQHLMMTDIRNLRAFALYLQNTDINFDIVSITTEIEKQVGYEFDFQREAENMDKISCFLRNNSKKPPVRVPRVIPHMVTRKVLIMEFIDGIPILCLGDEIAKRGIDSSGKMATAAKKNILQKLSLAYGQMILKSGFFHADPHPGNILIYKNSEVALLDYGQVKHLSDNLRLGYAKLIKAIVHSDTSMIMQSFEELGMKTMKVSADSENELLKLAQTLFDTKLPPGVQVMTPFADDSSLKKISVQSFPEELFFVLRTVQLLRGLSVGMGINYSCLEQWKPIAEEALGEAGLSISTPRCSRLRRLLFWR
ncbi:uncharacterized protein slr0889 isoform X2 [Amborella trichopoda]|nr:uncharacterized protein slr0889 isoform X2 [Amborella trichopoda]|eukprot:XP_006852140.2 uncharacterized protein slr0889 isoform X2 [Amborella trichopoda]